MNYNLVGGGAKVSVKLKIEAQLHAKCGRGARIANEAQGGIVFNRFVIVRVGQVRSEKIDAAMRKFITDFCAEQAVGTLLVRVAGMVLSASKFPTIL